MADGLLGRWSRRKLDAKKSRTVQAEPAAAVEPAADGALFEPLAAGAQEVPAQSPAEVSQPTLEDVHALTPESDFSRFAVRSVAPEVRNAAMKRLFSDPRYNVMDGLDVYIDDYSTPDPIAHAQLRQLASSKFLDLFHQQDCEEEEAARRRRDIADHTTVQSLAHADSAPAAVSVPPHHADPHLRLQQDHAAPGEDPGSGAG